MYELLSFVNRGKIRRKILELLKIPKTPTQISNIVLTQRPTISRTIIALQSKGLVECLTPKEKMGRYYQITPLGKKVLHKLEEISLKGGKN